MDYRFQEDIPAGLRDSIISYGPLGPLLTVGDRVVWVLRDGPQFGYVRWVGRLPDITDEGWTIGVEFDNPVGSGDGRFAGQRYFFGRQDHALFLPNTNLMRANEYHLQVAKYDGFGSGNQKVVVPPYTTLPSRTSVPPATPTEPEPQSEPCSANVTPAQNKRSMFGAFKLKKSKSLQETVEADTYDNGTTMNGSRPDNPRDRGRKEKSHFHLLPLRFPKSRSNSSVSSAPPNFGPPRIAGADQDVDDSSLSGEDAGLMSCLPSLGGSLLRRRKKSTASLNRSDSNGTSSKKSKKKSKKRANDQNPPFTFLTNGVDPAMADGTSSLAASSTSREIPTLNGSSRQFAVLQQYRDSLEARSTPRLEKKLPHLANPQPGASTEVQLHRFESHSPTIVDGSHQQQARHSRLSSQLEQRRSLLTPIIPPEDDFDFLSVQDRRSNSLQITRNRSPIGPPGEPSSLPLPGETDSHVIKKKKKRKAPAPPPLDLRPLDSSAVQLNNYSTAYSSSTASLGGCSSSDGGTSSVQRRLKKKAPLPPRKDKPQTASSGQAELRPDIPQVSVASAVSQDDKAETTSKAANPPESPRLNDLSRIDEDAESDFEYVLKRSDSKVNELVDAFHRLTEDSGELSPDIRSDDGTLTPPGGAAGSGRLSEASISSSTSTKWRYVDVSDSMSVDSNTSDALIGAVGGARRDSVSEYRLEFERRRAFYEPKNRPNSGGRASIVGSSGNRHSRSFDENPLVNASFGIASPAGMSYRNILKSQSNSSITSKGSTGSDKRPPIHPDSPTGGRKLLYKQLESAISKGEHDKAASLARQLALHKKTHSTITVNLYVEDKVSHVGPIRLNLNPTMKLRQLKQKIHADYRFPEDRQCWVIGSGLAVDDDRSLEELGVDKSEANIFLYLGSSTKYGCAANPGTPKSLPKKFLESFPSSIRHILPENKSRQKSSAAQLRRAESVDSDEMWHTTDNLTNTSSPEPSIARVRKRRQVVKLQADQSDDQLNRILQSQDTLKGWKCDLCGMRNRRAGNECVMCGSLNSVTGNEADDELFDGSLDDIVNLDRLKINKVKGEKFSTDLSPLPRGRFTSQGSQQPQPQSLEPSCSRLPPIGPKSRSVSRSPPRSPVFSKVLQPASMPPPAVDKAALSPLPRSHSARSGRIPRAVSVSESSPSPPKALPSPKTPPSADAVWHVNPSFESSSIAPRLQADLAVEEDFDISSESGSDTASVTSLEVGEKMFELDDVDEVGRITDELGLTEPSAAASTSKERPGSVIYRSNGDGQANGCEPRPERPTTAIFRPAVVSSAFVAEGAIKPVEIKHVVEEPARCISETTLGAQPQRAVLHMETGARPKTAQITKPANPPPPVPFKPIVTVQPWSARQNGQAKQTDPPRKFGAEIAAARNVFEEPKSVGGPGEAVDRKAEDAGARTELSEAIETLRTLTESPVKDYLKLMQLDDHDLVANSEEFECPVCLMPIGPKEGVVLRDCLHTFCRECLNNAVSFSAEATVDCPFMNDDYSCESKMQEREIKALVPEEVYEKHLRRSIKQAETSAKNSFHCKTPDCPGWCFFEDNVNSFDCPVCTKKNCLTCQAIHHPMNCLQYQDHLELEAELTEDAKKTKAFLEDMVRCNDALHCPQCRIILIRKWGCDWVKCSMCHTEICWVTRGPRWGPLGRGDTSGGCKCGVKGIKCHPKCTYCH